ncbi:MAG TPA: choice-of-anchor tandem repeat GloVer-containing protein [Rhizomicrobium sp.]|nr:choice-of-anchor tandem repeat GloVer-containing protein [Rhizomicrobium sp.]
MRLRYLVPAALAAVLALAAALAPAGAAHAWTLKTLYSFCAEAHCTDGSEPLAGLLRDSSGNLYGTTLVGGTHGDGVVFELAAGHRGLTYKVLHDFCYACGDGTNPEAGLIIDANGNLYGTTAQSGPTGCGTAFRLSPNADRSKWKEKTLYAAPCGFGNNILTGLTYEGAATGAPYDGTSPLYGATNMGGTGVGTVYEIVPKGTKWKEKDLYAFCPSGVSGCTDGRYPGTLIVDAAGNLYGNTLAGGTNSGGLVYELRPNAKNTKWTEHVLYNFCAVADCTDGGTPEGALVMDNGGNLFGTTTEPVEQGAVYELTQAGKSWTETVLHTFCSEQNCADGYLPMAGLVLDGAGNLYGTTDIGGTGDGGTVFQLQGSSFSTLYNFCSASQCGDGSAPQAPLIIDSTGNLYGTTASGGADDNGTVFELSP